MNSGIDLYLCIIILAGSFVCLIVSGLFQTEIQDVIRRFFAIFHSLLLVINNVLQGFWQGVGSFYRQQFAENGSLNTQTVFFQFIGSAMYTLFFTVFAFSEFHLLALSLVAAGIEQGHFQGPLATGDLTALAILSSFLFWGAIILDLSGMTNTAPWRESLDKKWRVSLLLTTIVMVLLTLVVTTTCGSFRGHIIADESLHQEMSDTDESLESFISDVSGGFAPPAQSRPQVPAERPEKDIMWWTPVICNAIIPLLIGFGGLCSAWGIVTFLKFMMLLTGFAFISPLGLLYFASTLSVRASDMIYQFADVLFVMVAEIGASIAAVLHLRRPNAAPSEPQTNHTGDPSSPPNHAEFQDHEAPAGESGTNDAPGAGDRPEQGSECPPNEDAWDPYGSPAAETHNP